MKLSLVSLTLLTAGLGSASAQNQVPGGTSLLVQPPQTQVQPAVTFVLGFPLLAMPETSPMPSRVKLTLSRPADTLEVSGQPRGMTVSVSQDTVTVETKGVPVGQYPLRITGRWGNETKAVELLVSVYALNGTVAPITGPAAPGPTIPTTQAPPPTVAPVVITTPTATVTTVTPQAPTPTAAVPTTPAPTLPAPTVPLPPVTSAAPEIRPVQAAPAPAAAPLTPLPAVTVTSSTPAPPLVPTPTTTTRPGQPGNSVPSVPMTVPYQTPPAGTTEPATSDPAGRFTVWGGMGTERGVLGGLNVGVSSRVAQFSVVQVAVRGTAELYPNTGSGLGLPVIGADVLLNREGSRLYYGPSTSLAFGAGNSWAVGGLVGYSSTLNSALGYYVEGRARYAHLGGQSTLSPGFKVGFTYHLSR